MRIRVSPEQLGQVALQFQQAQHQSQSSIARMRGAIGRLESQWSGVTREEFYQSFQRASQIMGRYLETLQKIEGDLKQISQKFADTDKKEDSSSELLKKAIISGLSTAGKLGFVASALQITANAKRADLVDIGVRDWVKNGKVAEVWSRLLPVKSVNTPQKMAAKLGNIDHTLPGGSIKATNIAKHIRGQLKPFGLVGVALTSVGEVKPLVSSIQDDIAKYDGLEAAGHVATDVAYSTTKVAATVGASYAGAVGGAQAGAFLGSFVLPPIGTAVGGIAGAIVGSSLGGAVVSEAIENLVPRERFKSGVKKLKGLLGL
ncbi:WXG100 family type VII secretion target [Paenibacillus sp. S-38]|uniref:WXG100 family type VII secretion target n=1 Tax=Paenibacillus sp. S-38 TaxID=3416710 RepID=UPI003CEF01A4